MSNYRAVIEFEFDTSSKAQASLLKGILMVEVPDLIRALPERVAGLPWNSMYDPSPYDFRVLVHEVV